MPSKPLPVKLEEPFMDNIARFRNMPHPPNHKTNPNPQNTGSLPLLVDYFPPNSQDGLNGTEGKAYPMNSLRTFRSILFDMTADDGKRETHEQPEFFRDLNLDQIIEAITIGRQEYNLKPFFHTPLHSVDAIYYRQETMKDLENKYLFESIKSFSEKMRSMRLRLPKAEKHYYKYQKERWVLDAVEVYCDAVNKLVDDLSHMDLKSVGFLDLREYLTNYIKSDHFTSLLAETKQVLADLSSLQYCLIIKGGSFKVRKYESETDYSEEVEATFEKFKQGAVKDYRAKFSDLVGMNHIEAKVLELVAQVYPDVFLSLENYCAKNIDYLDEKIDAFDREVQFYIAYLEYIEKFKRAGLNFCYPQVSDEDKSVYDHGAFDLALAFKLINDNAAIVQNDFYLKGKERIIVVSGPNQGGKTTFARTFGQLHYMASLGCPVPGRNARLFLSDRLFTHFEKEEDIRNLRGKLQDDLVRIHDILNLATTNSIILINEMFTSTTLQDAVSLGKKILKQINELDLPCVFVTFIDELSTLSEKTVSMVSTVVPDNPTLRTFKIVRRPADGLSYALSIAEKYRLTYESLKERIKS